MSTSVLEPAKTTSTFRTITLPCSFGPDIRLSANPIKTVQGKWQDYNFDINLYDVEPSEGDTTDDDRCAFTIYVSNATTQEEFVHSAVPVKPKTFNAMKDMATDRLLPPGHPFKWEIAAAIIKEIKLLLSTMGSTYDTQVVQIWHS